MSILVVGTVAFDAIETPFGKTDKIIGGAATYICLSASYISKQLNIVSVVGEDFPKKGIEMLKKHNTNIEGLQIKKGEKTFFWSGKYHKNMNNRDTIETQLNVLENFNPIVPKKHQENEYLMLGNLLPNVQQKVLNQMKKKPKIIVLDTMNFWMDNFMKDLKKALKKVDVITINDEEAEQLSEEKNLIKAAEKIQKMGPKYVIVKQGAKGALLVHKNKKFFTPAVELQKVVDPTGAGDSFAGGFIGYLAKTKNYSFENMKEAVIYGSVMASFCVQEFGTKGLEKINKEEIQKRIKELKEKTN